MGSAVHYADEPDYTDSIEEIRHSAIVGDFTSGMDDAHNHHSDEVVDLIHATGAVTIYSAPYSPTLNPIENYLSIYKKYLKNLGEVAFQDSTGMLFTLLH